MTKDPTKVDNPRQLTIRGLLLLEEAVLAVLFHEPDLNVGDISQRLGITNDDYAYLNRYCPIVRSVLNKLEKEKRVQNNRSKDATWRLTENEYNQREVL